MTLTNHTLAGAAIAKFLPLPLAIPLAFASHFILDSLPHWGFESVEHEREHMRLYLSVVISDFITTVIIGIWLVNSGHLTWLLVGLVAYSPDIVWIYRFIVKEKFGKLYPTKGNVFIQFHKSLQRYESYWGSAVELMFAMVLYTIVH